MVLFRLALAVASLQLALAFPSNLSTRMLDKRADPFFSDLHQPLFTAIQQAQIKQGFADACLLAQSALLFAKSGNPVYKKYFNDDADTLNNVQMVFNGIVGGAPPPDGTCSSELAQIAISNDFPNAAEDNELSCTSESVMASTRDGENIDLKPTMIICPSTLTHGNIGDTVIKDAPVPVTCDTVKEDGQRTTWRMNTVGSTILHEYTHIALLVGTALPQGTKDSLDHSDDPDIPEDVEFTFYGPFDIQGELRKVRGGTKSTIIADAYTWFANEALWTQKCGLTFDLAQEHDEEDPKYGNNPGQDPDTND